MSSENTLLDNLLEQIKTDALVLPTLPEIALRVRDAVDNPEASLHSITDEIAKDPALTASMIRIANSAFYARAVKVTNLNAAVNRIGLEQVKNTATSMAMKQMFICQNDVVFDYFDRAWCDSVDVASAAGAIFAAYKLKHPGTALESDTLCLMGLVHNIGILPILAEAEKNASDLANRGFLDQAIRKLTKHIGVAIIKKWDFDKSFAIAIAKWNADDYEPKSVDYIDFIRIGAVYAGLLGQGKAQVDLLQPYLEKGVIESLELFDTDEFKERFAETQEAFSA
ncbi:HDOD domain-containing protein [Corallincola luteus]|uniref:HDOD domain-containing protein n=1 Tax=Corallincola luteus TaxID=1775177 RepID=A0ABY2ARZ3_9GAMM|nr:HDOD domain-containing protein [Corallincola luteus]TCI05263.1 HDOD domain-containing protein [Corallincola luteus]